jgi:hypothetical protein
MLTRRPLLSWRCVTPSIEAVLSTLFGVSLGLLVVPKSPPKTGAATPTAVLTAFTLLSGTNAGGCSIALCCICASVSSVSGTAASSSGSSGSVSASAMAAAMSDSVMASGVPVITQQTRVHLLNTAIQSVVYQRLLPERSTSGAHATIAAGCTPLAGSGWLKCSHNRLAP